MAYNNDGGDRGGFEPRKMYQGSWKCSKCGAEITELPFEPDPEKSDRLMCRDCFREKKQAFRRGPRPPFRR
jgi:CxxC-x17-CxxC domain-containing protein